MLNEVVSGSDIICVPGLVGKCYAKADGGDDTVRTLLYNYSVIFLVYLNEKELLIYFFTRHFLKHLAKTSYFQYLLK